MLAKHVVLRLLPISELIPRETLRTWFKQPGFVTITLSCFFNSNRLIYVIAESGHIFVFGARRKKDINAHVLSNRDYDAIEARLVFLGILQTRGDSIILNSTLLSPGA